MARSSVGSDVFSPVRFDLSFDDNVIYTEVKTDRGSIVEKYEKLKRPSTQRCIENYKSVASLDKESSKKVDALSEENGRKLIKKSNNNGSTVCETTGTKGQLTASNSLKVLKSPNREFNNTTSKSPRIDELLHKKSKSRRSKDRISDQEINKKDKNSLPVSSENVPSSGTKKTSNDTLPSKFITVRRDRKKNSFISSVDILPVHSERHEDEKASALQNLKDCSRSVQPHDLTTEENKSSGTKAEPVVELESISNQVKPENTSTTSSEKAQSPKHTIDKTSTTCTADPNQNTGLQRNIIEKLISETVSYEFDGIRRQMYLQQISVLKLLNTRMDEFEIKHANTTQALYEIIADLLEENRKLKNALIAYQ